MVFHFGLVLLHGLASFPFRSLYVKAFGWLSCRWFQYTWHLCPKFVRLLNIFLRLFRYFFVSLPIRRIFFAIFVHFAFFPKIMGFSPANSLFFFVKSYNTKKPFLCKFLNSYLSSHSRKIKKQICERFNGVFCSVTSQNSI